MTRAVILAAAAAAALSGAAVVPAQRKADPMPEPKPEGEPDNRVPPNRLAVDPASDYYDAAALPGLNVYVNGRKMPGNVVEYDIARGTVRCYLKDGQGNPRRERGKLSTFIIRGTVEARYD